MNHGSPLPTLIIMSKKTDKKETYLLYLFTGPVTCMYDVSKYQQYTEREKLDSPEKRRRQRQGLP